MNYIYLDAQYHDKLLEDANKFDKEKLYRFMIREINKTKNSQDTNEKLLTLFREFKLVEFCKSTYLKATSERKIKLIEDFMLLPMQEIYDLLLPILSGNYPIPVKLSAIKSLTQSGFQENAVQIMLALSSMPEAYNKEISEILLRLSQTHPFDTISPSSTIDTSVQPTLSKRFISLLFQEDCIQSIAGAYMIGFLRVKSASRFLAEKLMNCENKEGQIAVLIALRKLNDVDTSTDLVQFLTQKEKLSTDSIQECLNTLQSYGLVGQRQIEKLSSSSVPILKVMAKSFLTRT